MAIGFITGGFASEIGAGLGAVTNLSVVAKGAIQAGAYASLGGTTSFMTGGDFLSGAISGAAGSVVGSFTSGLTSGMNSFWSGATIIGSSAVAGGVSAELTGGDFWRGAMLSGLTAAFNHAAHTINELIAATAEKYIGREDWAYEAERDNFGMQTNKCNKFVYDVLKEAGVETHYTRYGLSSDLVPLSKNRPYTAGEWGDPEKNVTNWKVVTKPRRGDIAAYKAHYSDATGHVGIVTGSGKGVWANYSVIRQDYINNKVWNTDHPIIFRRYTGPVR